MWIKRHRTKLVLIALLAVFALVASACGDDDDSDSGSPSTSAAGQTTAPSDDSEPETTQAPSGDDDSDDSATETTEATSDDDEPEPEPETTEPPIPRPTGDPIKLMTIGSISGPLGISETEDAVKAAEEAVNAAGGIHGRPLEVLICDDESNPNISSECGRKAVKEGVVAVVGSNTGGGDLYMPALTEAEIPSVGNMGRSVQELTSPFSYPIGGGIAVALAAMGYGLGENGATKIHAAIPATGNARILAGLFLNAGLARYDLTLDGETGFDPTAADITPLVQSTLEGGTDGIALLMTPDFINKYLLTLPNLGAAPLLVSSTLVYSTTNFDIVGDAAEGMILAGQILPATYTDNPGVQRYHDDLDAIGSDEARSQSGINAWAAVHVVAEIMQGMDPGDVDSSAALIAAMESAGEIEFEPVPPFNWSEPISGYAPAERVFSDHVVLSEIRDGRIVALSGEYVSLSQ